ncbi:MAG: hypothetical protein ACAH83_11785 [Alphaproteobacteria bacterium]
MPGWGRVQKEFTEASVRRMNHDVDLLKHLGIEYSIRLDGTVYVPGSVSLSNKELKQLPDFSTIEVMGGFYCYGNELKDLTGAPAYVGEAFDASCNKLESLRGAPQKVGGRFSCAANQLTSLEHGPDSVGGGYYCHENKLVSLAHGPSECTLLKCDFGTAESLEDFTEMREHLAGYAARKSVVLQGPISVNKPISLKRQLCV